MKIIYIQNAYMKQKSTDANYIVKTVDSDRRMRKKFDVSKHSELI